MPAKGDIACVIRDSRETMFTPANKVEMFAGDCIFPVDNKRTVNRLSV